MAVARRGVANGRWCRAHRHVDVLSAYRRSLEERAGATLATSTVAVRIACASALEAPPNAKICRGRSIKVEHSEPPNRPSAASIVGPMSSRYLRAGA
jgi:hypothetical protein